MNVSENFCKFSHDTAGNFQNKKLYFVYQLITKTRAFIWNQLLSSNLVSGINWNILTLVVFITLGIIQRQDIDAKKKFYKCALTLSSSEPSQFSQQFVFAVLRIKKRARRKIQVYRIENDEDYNCYLCIVVCHWITTIGFNWRHKSWRYKEFIGETEHQPGWFAAKGKHMKRRATRQKG